MKRTSTDPLWNLVRRKLGNNFAEDKDLQAAVRNLSRFFTEERGKGGKPLDYWADPKLCDAYIAYFFPLNFLKTLHLLGAFRWPGVMFPASGAKILDLGCGPGTAAAAALVAAHAQSAQNEKQLRTPFHVDLVDSSEIALDAARDLITELAGILDMDVTIGTWTSLAAAKAANPGAKYELTLAANLLNELPSQESQPRETLIELWDLTSGQMLVLEPGHRVSSQRLIRFRERLLKLPGGKAHLLGPCTHEEKCPLYRSKHWCHFSEVVGDGRMIDLNLRIFKNPRLWLKFSYCFFSRTPSQRASVPGRRFLRAIGDLHPAGPTHQAIDLCQPESKFVLRLPRRLPPELINILVRGNVIQLDEKGNLAKRLPRK